MPWRRHRPVNAARECWGSVMNQDGGFKQEVTISMQTQQPWVRQVMPGWVYHWALGQVSVAGGGGGAAAGAVAGGFGDGGFGNAGTETRRRTARQSRAPADSPWEPLWTAACPCRWGMGGVGIGNQTEWRASAHSHTNVKWHFHSSYMKTQQMQIVVLRLHVCVSLMPVCWYVCATVAYNHALKKNTEHCLYALTSQSVAERAACVQPSDHVDMLHLQEGKRRKRKKEEFHLHLILTWLQFRACVFILYWHRSHSCCRYSRLKWCQFWIFDEVCLDELLQFL